MLYKGGDCLSKNKIPWEKRICVKHAGAETPLRILCVGSDCACFVYVPIREGKEGGAESHEWSGCMYVLAELRKYAEMGMSIDKVLSRNR